MRSLMLAVLAVAPLAAETVVCAPSAPVVIVNGNVTLHAWSDAAPERNAKWSWSVETGTVESGNAGEAIWKVGDAEDGPQTAEVLLKAGTVTLGTCSVEVRIVNSFNDPGTRGEGRAAFHSFLESLKDEPSGFGQYSYLLFGSAPKDADKGRYKAILTSLLTQIPATAELAKYHEPANLNATFIPVTRLPQPGGTLDAEATWSLDHYDYTRATALLSKVPGVKPGGIYLVSGTGPWLTPKGKGPYLVQDLSAIPANLISTWVTAFVNQAAQIRYWEASTPDELVLKLRLSLSVLSVGVPQVQEAVKKWITLEKS